MSDPLDKHFTIKPASQILPEREPYKEGNFTDACDALKRLWSKYDINMGHHYKKGEMLASAREIYGQDDYEKLFLSILRCLFQCAREDIDNNVKNVEEKQEILMKLKGIENIYVTSAHMFKFLNFKLDNKTVLPIMNGYINECIKRVFPGNIKDFMWSTRQKDKEDKVDQEKNP